MKPADRIAGFDAYFFLALGKRIAELRSNGTDIIRLDIGSPDLPPAEFIVDALVEFAHQPGTHGYTLGSGVTAFRQAVADHMSRRFGVSVAPKSEVVELIGSKEGLFILSQVLLNPGDVALVPDPAYAVYAAGAKIAGGKVYIMPLLAQNKFLPDLAAIPADVARRAKVLWLNYPNNPTGAVANLEFFAQAVEFARQYDLLLAHDAPYTEVCFDNYRAPSLLQVPGAKEVAVEFNSLSKAYNMAGWRLGYAVGHPDAIKYIETYKSQQDSSIFAPILAAGVAALQGEQSWLEARNDTYKARRDAVLKGLQACGLSADIPQASLYVWSQIPEGRRSEEFCDKMLHEIGVSVTPGVVFGRHGEGYMRISLGTPIERIELAMTRIANWLPVKV